MSEEPQTDFAPKSLDDIVSPGNEPAPKPDPAPEPAKTPDPAKAEGGKEPKGDPAPEKDPEKAEKPKDAPPASETKDIELTVPLKALQEERRKRQELANQVGELQKQVTRKPRPDPYEDPQGAAEYDRKEASEQSFSMRVEMSQEMMREIHADYDEIEAVFMEEASSNPALAAQLSSHPFPAKFAYQEGKRVQQLKVMGDDPAAYIEKIKAEAAQAARAAVLEELKKGQAEAQKASIPESLAEAPSASRKDASQWGGPKPLSEIIK